MFHALILASLLIGAEAKAETQLATPLEFGTATVTADGSLQILYPVCKPIYETRNKNIPSTVTEVVDGKPVTKTVVRTVTCQVTHLVPEERVATAAADQFRIWRDGKAVDAQAAAALLKEPTPVAFCNVADVAGPAPAVPNLLAPGTLVVTRNYTEATMPRRVVPGPPPAAPAACPAPAAPAPAVAPAPAPCGPAPIASGPERLVLGRCDEQGRLVLREQIGGATGIMLLQVLDLEFAGQKHRKMDPYPLGAVYIERVVELANIVAVDRHGQKVEAAKLAASLKKSWTPTLICYSYPGMEKSDPADLPKPGPIVDCLGPEGMLLKVPYPMIGQANTRILDLTTSFPPAPRFGAAQVDDQNRVSVRFMVVKYVPEQRVKTVNYTGREGGESQARTTNVCYTVWKPVYETCVHVAKGDEFVRPAGISISSAKSAELIGKGKAVLISADGKPIHPFYLKGVSTETLVFVPPASVPMPAPAPCAAPPAVGAPPPPSPTSAPPATAPPPPPLPPKAHEG